MSDKIVSILNDLIETSNNGEKGFSTAAEDTRNPELSSVFRQRAQDCARAAKDLQQMVVRLGGSGSHPRGSRAEPVIDRVCEFRSPARSPRGLSQQTSRSDLAQDRVHRGCTSPRLRNSLQKRRRSKRVSSCIERSESR